MNDEITVKSIREAKKGDRTGLIVRYICDKRSDAIIPNNKQIRVLTMFSCLMEEDIEMDRYATLRFYPTEEKGDNAFSYVRDYFGLDARQPMSVEALWQKYPDLYYTDQYENVEELENWYESITIQTLIHVRDKVKEAEQRIAQAEEELEKERIIAAREKKKRAEYLARTHDPVIHNKWILPGKMDEFYRRRMQRLYKAES